MKIHSVKYYDKYREWGYDTIHFSDLTLLVGVSGAGKTQILRSLINLRFIADGMSWNARGVNWEISFSNDGAEYFWIGEFEHQKLNGEKKGREDDPKFVREIIRLNGKIIAQRKENDIYFEDEKMPKLAPEKSLISIFKEEESIKKAFEGFKKIVHRDYVGKEISPTNYSEIQVLGGYATTNDAIVEAGEKYKTLEEIRESNLDSIHKLYCIFKNQKSTFNIIKERFLEIFQQVEDVKIVINNDVSFIDKLIEIFIKEKGVNKWISHQEMSSGMLRTFLHISEIYLLKKGSVVLIDEFESSLGTNCINALAEDLMFENNDIQFIITSHHPYIINQIPYEYWKIVTRENGKIVTYNADEFNLGESHHERFMNLINLPTYKKGIVHA